MPNENKSETYFRVLKCPGIRSSPVMVYTHGSFLEKNSIMVGTKGRSGRYTSVIKKYALWDLWDLHISKDYLSSTW